MEDVISQENNPLKSDEKQITVDSNIQRIPLFHVSLAKLTIMFVATFGLYQIYWFYKQWQALKAYYDLDAWPIARCIFTVFFTHSLFVYVDEYIKEDNRSYRWSHSALATVYVLLIVVSSILNNIEVLPTFFILISIFIPLAVLYPLYEAQKAINFALEPLDYEDNSSLTWLNWIWIALFGFYWAMVIYALTVLVRLA
ncbi:MULTISPECIES: hypothetical protein [unclassified Shewanella]|uniref:hypothetical protein n=1 Tax=unclassified Shewanella TaxID=196818 RepID=UPI000F70EF61|nr:hypothetical protein [Shewanella sp. GD04112]MDH0450164.1 hypothetical protein [Shewanella sp. GD04112]VEE61550.1 Uncharacterised protein [Shewanella putrefaciens]